MVQSIFRIVLSVFLILGIFADSASFKLYSITVEYVTSISNASDEGRIFALFVSENGGSEEEPTESDEDKLDKDLEDSSKFLFLKNGAYDHLALKETVHKRRNHLSRSYTIKRHILYHHLKIYC